MEGYVGNEHSNNFDQTFGSNSSINSISGNSYSNTSTTPNLFGGTDVIIDGRTVASTKQSYIHDGHDTYVDGKNVSSTNTTILGETTIKDASGQEIGVIRDSLYGNEKELYINQEHFATAQIDVSGNHRIMQLEDPLTRAHEYALTELILSNK
jgi:hypothetical protein